MPTVTALHPERRDRVRVELDGEPWRTLPAAAVVAARLGVGVPLDRSRARELGRALRRAEALDAAGRALARRERSAAGLAAQLERRGVAPAARAAAVETMERLGYVNDDRFAVSRAGALASRGFGDAAIRFELEREGVAGDQITTALASLEVEVERARALAAGSGDRQRIARRLVSHGFSPESVEAAVGMDDPSEHQRITDLML